MSAKPEVVSTEAAAPAATAATPANEPKMTQAAPQGGSGIPAPPEGLAYIISHGSKKVIPIPASEVAKIEKRITSRFQHPAWKYGLGTLISVISGGAGYAGGVYMANRKHQEATEPKPSED